MVDRAGIASVGLVAGGRVGVDHVWDLVLRRGIGIQAGPEIDWTDELGRKNARRWSLATRMAVTAAREAASGQAPTPEELIGVFLAPTTTSNDLARALTSQPAGAERPAAHLTSLYSSSSAVSMVATDLGAGGPVVAFEAACSSSAVAVGEASRYLARGAAALIYAGGADSQVDVEHPGERDWVQEMFGALRITAPPAACRPFDPDRAGMFSAPGAAILRLEAPGADANAQWLAEIAGSAMVFGGKDYYSPEPTGDSLARAIDLALAEAGVDPSAVELVIAHGTGTVANDVAEAAAIRRTVGSDVPVTSIKSRIGHTSYASGSMNVAMAALAIRHRVIPPTSGTKSVDPLCAIKVVTEPAEWVPGPVLALSMGLGGFNSCVVVVPPGF